MYHPIYIFIGLRYLWNSHLPKFKKFLILLSIMGISISVFSLIIIISIMNGCEKNFEKNILSFIPHLIITNKNKYVNKSEFPKNILKLNSIKKISDFINKDILIKNKNNITTGQIVGIDINNDKNIGNYHIKNILDLLKPDKYNAIIGKELAKKLDIHIGDEIKIILLSKNIKEQVFKIISIFSTQNEIDYYQILINKKDSMHFLNYSKNYITGWRVWLKKPLSLNFQEIKKIVHPLILYDWTLQKGNFFKAIRIEKYMMIFLFILVLLVAIFNIFITLSIYTIEKTNTIAILKSQGLSDWKIMLIFITLGSSISIIGSTIGTIVSIVLIIENNCLQSFIQVVFNSMNIPIIMMPFQIFFINIISIFITIFATFYPAWNAIKIQPSRILSNE
ncbi:FtsX-like permease family protein [Buchnera aphidicola (Brachycaudus cardui)]|uniref:FtsX-like permease family protein n=1 Tax=Buchnera aphidicola (Brachycaudus cardui) TaxID=557993 RepID=A0A4D6Y3I3_9GAMM|nr:FtsX-like permease family protein [Buchnera aphidicola]QCI20431.1 FtsX-like permease family protein [Buchnera aphidicola (Brachycaudus cardui)]